MPDSAAATRPIAHVRQNSGGTWIEHLLIDHLRDVQDLSRGFGETFGAGDWAGVAGLWHDLGKYSNEFQGYIRRASGYDPGAHLENVVGKVDHSTAGAIHAHERSEQLGRLLGYLIAGHHAGLPDWATTPETPGGSLSDRVSNASHLSRARSGGIPLDLLDAPLPTSIPDVDPDQRHLWLRLVFSCLVDADFLDTEAFMEPTKALQRRSETTLEELRARLDDHRRQRDAQLLESGQWSSPVNKHRRTVYVDCLRAAAQSPGLLSLTVPTGGGKTLSSMAFALDHAVRHNMRRVVVAIPFTSIIEQTAEVFRGVFGNDAVVEHHSALDPDRETPRGRLAAENWDAPVIVTTNIQLLESLFAARPSRCRKLHNLVRSVIVLDEAQTLPPGKLMPTLSVLSGLVRHFDCSVVLCTATQPALIGQFDVPGEGAWRGLDLRSAEHPKGVLEIVRDPDALSRDLRRVSLELRTGERQDWPTLARELAPLRQVLCIVNRRKDCRELWSALSELCSDAQPVHLSALMCAEHRSRVISRVKRCLEADVPVRVVSTQLVEAGVDIDFPVVFRAMAGLDRIAQAAGRCNREGRLNAQGRLGRVVIFEPCEPSPAGLLRKGEDACRETLRTFPEASRALRPKALKHYFRGLFGRANTHGKRVFKQLLVTDSGSFAFQFRTAARWYRLIDDAGARSIAVWYATERHDSRSILADLERFGPSRARMRRLQRFVVSVPGHEFERMRDAGLIAEVTGREGPLGLWAQCVPDLYDEALGLQVDARVLTAEDFVC